MEKFKKIVVDMNKKTVKEVDMTEKEAKEHKESVLDFVSVVEDEK